jgi:hypothetical protein
MVEVEVVKFSAVEAEEVVHSKHLESQEVFAACLVSRMKYRLHLESFRLSKN